MIQFIDATKYYPTAFGRHYIFRDVSLTIPEKVNVGIVGGNGAGKSTLMRLIAGVDILSGGRIVRTGRISWPLGLTAGLQAKMTGKENARFVCRIHGLFEKPSTGSSNGSAICRASANSSTCPSRPTRPA
jgi:capsular polysaccharide transport system ATP-binding protein